MPILEHVEISHLSGYQTPAKARYFIEYTGSNIDELRQAVVSTTSQNLPILTLAGGRNSLLAFDEYPGLVIHNSSKSYEFLKTPFVKGGEKERLQLGDLESKNPPSSQSSDTSFLKEVYVKADSGYPIWQLAEELENIHGINFWHRFQGLPGSIGGAVFGNAGCFGLEIGPYVKSIEILGMTHGNTFTKTNEELHFDYRWSECKNHPYWFILSVTCDLSQMIEKYPAPEEDPLAWRARVQPAGFSCGSFFKNPSREHSAGSLIEQVGLKGYHHGGAYFSEKHANFLMSDGTATWQELLQLIKLAQKQVKEKTGFDLEPEVRIIHA